MENTAYRALAIVGVGAILPDAPNAPAFWDNVKKGRYSVSEVAPDRWDPALYYDPDRSVPDKAYSKIGGWVRDYQWDPLKWRLAIPPRVVDAMDDAQKWAVACTREALDDYGYPARPMDLNRTAVILGNAMGGEKHYLTVLRIYFPEYARELAESASFVALPAAMQRDITRELHQRIAKLLPEISEDTMPGELANCTAGRVANLFNFRGPNFTTDAACASAMAAMQAATEGLVQNHFDLAVTGGIDRNMGASTYIKFCKIGALSATGTRPYAEGADGFVMGEGAAVFLLKRLADAERDDDKIYAVVRGIGGSSDGKGKGITAPNPIGQKLCIERAWEHAGLSPATATMLEGHGTSTSVGDVVEAQSMADVLSAFHLPLGSVALGSVKSNFGHLKGAAGAAGLLKAALALRDKVLPPSLHCEHPNPNIDFAHSPLYVNSELRPWTATAEGVRRAGASAFGFGGTNFHVVLEEYIPHRLTGNGKRWTAVSEMSSTVPGNESTVAQALLSVSPRESGAQARVPVPLSASCKAPLRGAMVIGAVSQADLAERLRSVQKEAEAGRVPPLAAPAEADLRAPERVVIDYADAADLAEKSSKALKALAANQAPVWKALRAQGVFRGYGPAPKVAFLYTGQGSQYANMLRQLRAAEPIVARTFAEADRVMTPLLGKPLSDFVFVDQDDAKAVAKAEEDLRQTEITQPTVLAIDMAMTRLLAAYGIHPDMTMGHSLGEYGALVAAGALPFEEALEAVSARGRGMAEVAGQDNGRMAAVFAPLEEIEKILKTIDGYVVVANVNSKSQGVIGGASKAVEQAMEVFVRAGYNVVPLPVSHAFHTSIVAPASEPLRRVLERLHLESPRVPTVANVNGEFYPTGPDVVPQMVDILARQVASPVQFVKGLETLYHAGARVFVEVGPKKALQGFAEDVLSQYGDAVSIFTNHPKVGDIVAFNQALCSLYAAGLGRGTAKTSHDSTARTVAVSGSAPAFNPPPVPLGVSAKETASDRGWQTYHAVNAPSTGLPVTITGAALGLPGTEHIFDDANIGRILRGDQFIDVIPTRFRRAILDKHITRLVKSENGGPTFELINTVADVIKLAGRGGAFDPEGEFGISADRLAALDRVTRLAMGAGLDALRDAGIPLVMHYKTTSKGTELPERWGLPDGLRDDTGVICASAFPGYDSFAEELSHYYTDRGRREQLALLEGLRAQVAEKNGHSKLGQEMDRRIDEVRGEIEKEPYAFDRRFVFRVLAMGHSQFAEFIGARGPNTQINAACASTTQAVALAEDWIHAGRCRRVIVIAADDATSDSLMEWMGAGFLATGAAATDAVVEEAALPFDRRRHGMILGMGAAAMVVESVEAARERGIQPICEVLSAVTANSAFHGTRLDLKHICQVMEELVAQAEARSGISRQEMAPQMVFVSHETYTPARGGSAAAEINALRRVFGDVADQIVITNTKGFTGHAIGVGVEDVVAVKALETGCVPPVANFKEMDPELGPLNLSKGGTYPISYALRFGAGFGSQISMTLMRWAGSKDAVRRRPRSLGYAYRIIDPSAWNASLGRMAGGGTADLEVVHRTLRVRDRGLAARVAEADQESLGVPAAIAKHPAPPPKTVAETKLPPPAASSTLRPATEGCASGVPPVPEHGQDGHGTSGSPIPTVVTDPVKQRVLSVVAEKTGYPVDMLDLDLDLEADLGVDTVKQAEVFATVREAYGIARDDKLKLRDFPTLGHVIQFVYDRRRDLAGAAPPSPVAGAGAEAEEEIRPAPFAPAPMAQKDDASDAVKERVLALVVEKTGYPKDMLDLDLDLEADLGIDTVKQAEMFAAVRETYNIPRDENLKLRDFPTLARVIQFVFDKRPDLADGAKSSSPAVEQSSAAPIGVAAQTGVDDPIKERVLEIVAEKTGYPQDMLDLELDLEADLGIDTVKQAEMFASVRAEYHIPRDETLKLRDFPTLAHVIKFARDRREGSTAAPSSSDVAPGFRPAPADLKVDATSMRVPRPILASLDAANSIPRRVPVPNLRPPLIICKPTGVTLGPGGRVIIMPDKGGVAEALTQRLQTMGVEVLTIEDMPDSDALTDRLKSWLSAGPVQGVYWLPALDSEGSLREMDLSAWREALRLRVKSLYTTMRILYAQVAPPGTFLVSATRLGGQHGYGQGGAVAPLGGAVVGFAKAYKRERMEALVKAVDFEPVRDASEIAQSLIEETLCDPGAVEIGYQGGQRWTVGLQEQPAADGHPGLVLNKDTIFLITGAAGSIVSAITADLAAASGGTFYLLDLAPEPDHNNPDLNRLVSDKEGLKRDLFARIQARGERATPALVEKELAALERSKAALSAIDAVQASGGKACYFSVDLKNTDAVGKIIGNVREGSGRIDVLLHAAGMERSHFLPDKNPSEFDLVFDVKSDGWFNLLHAIGDMPLGTTISFSSIAARFGNGGQADYSAANDLLCKIASNFRTTRPATRAIAIDWTAWSGIGMAARGSIPKMMELAGIDMLPPEAGIPLIRRELTMGGTRGEVVIGQRLGILLSEWDSTGGLATTPLEAVGDIEPASGNPQEALFPDTMSQGPMIGKIANMGLHHGLTIETTLDPKVQPFLYDHQIDGTPVLPGVMGIEAFAEAALWMLPGWQVEAIEAVDFLAPFKFYRNEPRTLTVQVTFCPQNDGLRADCRLIGSRTLPNQSEPQITTHFRARVRLTKQGRPVAVTSPRLAVPAGPTMAAADIYRVYFHGPAYQVVERAWRDGNRIIGEMAKDLPSHHHPPERPLVIAPRLIELCFQTAGLWEMSVQGRMGLPQHVHQVCVWAAPEQAEGRLYAVVTPDPDHGSFDAEVVDTTGKQYLRLCGYRTVALPNRVEAEPLKALGAAA